MLFFSTHSKDTMFIHDCQKKKPTIIKPGIISKITFLTNDFFWIVLINQNPRNHNKSIINRTKSKWFFKKSEKIRENSNLFKINQIFWQKKSEFPKKPQNLFKINQNQSELIRIVGHEAGKIRIN